MAYFGTKEWMAHVVLAILVKLEVLGENQDLINGLDSVVGAQMDAIV